MRRSESGEANSEPNPYALAATVCVLLLALTPVLRQVEPQNLLSIVFWSGAGIVLGQYGVRLLKRRDWLKGLVAFGIGAHLLLASCGILWVCLADPQVQHLQLPAPAKEGRPGSSSQ